MTSVDFMLKFDKGDFDEDKKYAGPFWAPKDALIVMSQNFSINYLSYLHDCAYAKPQGHGVKEIDFHYWGSIIEETNNLEVADTYLKWIKRFNFISWNTARIKGKWNGTE